MSQLQCASRVVGVKEVFDGNAIGLALVEECDKPGVNLQELFRKWGGGLRPDGAAGDDPVARWSVSTQP